MKRIVKNPAVRKAEIIKAAAKLFFEKEYEKTTLQDVMEYLGIAKGTIYHYFDSKEELLEAVVIDLVDARLNEIEDKLKEIGGNALQKMEKLVELSSLAKEHPKFLKQLHRPINTGLHIQILIKSLIKLAPVYENLIQQGCDEGIFQTKHPRESAEFILSAVQFLTDRGIYSWAQDDLARRMKAFPDLIEQQLNATPGSFNFLFRESEKESKQ